jgi:hypothetical protein
MVSETLKFNKAPTEHFSETNKNAPNKIKPSLHPKDPIPSSVNDKIRVTSTEECSVR